MFYISRGYFVCPVQPVTGAENTPPPVKQKIIAIFEVRVHSNYQSNAVCRIVVMKLR